MGVYNTVSINTSFSDRVNSLVNYLNNLDGVSAELASETVSGEEYTGAAFSLANSSVNGFFGYNGTLRSTYIWVKNGESYLVSAAVRGGNTSGTLTIHSYIDEECIMVCMYDSHYNNDGLSLALIKMNDDSRLVGYSRLSSATFADISALTFENISDSSRIQYTYTNMFPYSAAPGTLDFLAQSCFVNNGTRRYICELLKECSTVSLLSTVSLPSPLGNHVAIGAHCIAPITEGGT